MLSLCQSVFGVCPAAEFGYLVLNGIIQYTSHNPLTIAHIDIVIFKVGIIPVEYLMKHMDITEHHYFHIKLLLMCPILWLYKVFMFFFKLKIDSHIRYIMRFRQYFTALFSDSYYPCSLQSWEALPLNSASL